MNYLRVLRLSGGVTSHAAGQRLADAGVKFQMVFADTIIEDNDTYRFLIEGAARLSGMSKEDINPRLLKMAIELPELEAGTVEFRRKRLRERKIALRDLRNQAVAMIPRLTWLCDGRTPFEVFKDVRYLGNSRIDPCSKILNRQTLDQWARENCNNQTIHYFGLDWTEPKRLRRFREAMNDRRIEFPMADSPFVTKMEAIAVIRSGGIQEPRLYQFGFPHGNCGGGCIKFGQKQAAILLKSRTKYFGWWEDEENDMREFLDRDIAILRDRRGGKTKPMPLRVLRENIDAGQGCDQSDIGSCNCFEVEEVA